MNEIKKLNAKIRRKQIGRIVGGFLSLNFGMVLIAKYMYQRGITDGQKAICEAFPDEYAAMTAKVAKACNNRLF